MIRDKLFAMYGSDKKGREIITLKLESMHGQFLREQYKGDIVPGYYMNKVHWNSVLYMLRVMCRMMFCVIWRTNPMS
jgi:predicted DNA-binding protein (MmcQ/YjbR family)